MTSDDRGSVPRAPEPETGTPGSADHGYRIPPPLPGDGLLGSAHAPSCAPLMPRELLRGFARLAGCHVYTDFPAQTYHCDGHVGIYFHETGLCRVELPSKAAEVRECHSGTVLGRNCDHVLLEAHKNRAVLLAFSGSLSFEVGG